MTHFDQISDKLSRKYWAKQSSPSIGDFENSDVFFRDYKTATFMVDGGHGGQHSNPRDGHGFFFVVHAEAGTQRA